MMLQGREIHMIKDRPLNITGYCQWREIYQQWVQHKKFNWVNFNFITFNLEWGGYKGDYFEIEVAVLGFGGVIEWFDYQQRSDKVKDWLKNIPEEKDEKSLRDAGFMAVDEVFDNFRKNNE